ncbi:RIOX1, partial [Symbiodinium sp. CCMP2456]
MPEIQGGSVKRRKDPEGKRTASHLKELGLALPQNFFQDFEDHWRFLPGSTKAAETFRRIWGFKSVLKHAVLGGFKAYEFGIPRPTYDAGPADDAARRAKRALRRNLTLVQNHVHRGDALLSRYLRRAALLFGLPGGLNSYTTPALAVGFGYHFDPSDAIILQVEGNKTWEICGRRFPNAFSFANLTYNQIPNDAEDVANCSEVVLREGDALYLPVGQVHRAQANKALSIHLTMSLNRQFCSSTAVLLNVAEQINPSKEFGFAQPTFVSWVHATAADPSLAPLHAVPPALRCRPRGKQRFCPAWRGFLDEGLAGKALAKDPPGLPEAPDAAMLSACVEDLRKVVRLLKAHPASAQPLLLGVRLAGKEAPVVGKLPPTQVLDGIAQLLGPQPCNRTLLAWQKLLLRQHQEYYEASFRLDDFFDESTVGSAVLMVARKKGRAAAQSKGDVVMTPAGQDAKVKKTINKSRRRKATASQAKAAPESRKQRRKRLASSAVSGGESEEELRKRQAEEWKSMKAKVAALKKDRQKLPTRGSKEKRQTLNQDIRRLQEDMQVRHLAELRAAGLEATTKVTVAGHGLVVCTANPNLGKELLNLDEADAESAEAKLIREELEGHSEWGDDETMTTPFMWDYPEESSLPDRIPPWSKLDRKAEPEPHKLYKLQEGGSGMQLGSEVHSFLDFAMPQPGTPYATEHVHSFAQYSLPLNANWARAFGHSFVVDARARASGGVDVKNSKVLVKKHWVDHPKVTEGWVLWIGADAVLVNFDRDILRQTIRLYATPHTQVIITRDPHGRAGDSMSLFNADVILIRRSPWSSQFLQRWWDDERMKEGRTDQEVLELLYVEDVLGARQAFVLLPPGALNSDSLSIIAGPPSEQPVVHLGGHSDAVRQRVFSEGLRLLCQEQLASQTLELRSAYVKALWQEVQSPGEGRSSGHVHASTLAGHFQRLAWQLEELRRPEEALAVQRRALAVMEQRLGSQHHQTHETALALGVALRDHGRLREAEPQLRAACRGMARMLGKQHRDVFSCASQLGLALVEQRPQEAEVLFRRAHKGYSKALGLESTATATAALNLAESRKRLGRPDEAEPLLRA